MNAILLAILFFSVQSWQPAIFLESNIGKSASKTFQMPELLPSPARKLRHPPDMLGSGFEKKRRSDQARSSSFSTKALYTKKAAIQRDITLTTIYAPSVAVPKSFPPFPQAIDLDVSVQPMAATYGLVIGSDSARGKEVAYWDIDGMIASRFQMTGPVSDDTVSDTIESQILDAERLLNSGGVREAFERYSKIVKTERTTLTKDEVVSIANCHKALGEILYKYAWIALESNRVETGRKRLRNAWTEFKRALFLNPSDKQSLSQLLVISKYAAEQEPKFDNWLAYGSALYLSGNKSKARECYRRCQQLNPTANVLKQLPR